MGTRRVWIFGGVFLALLAVGAGYWLTQDRGSAAADEDEQSKPAADFTFPDLQGKPLKLSSLRGKTVLLDFWATWCGPCIEDIPALERLQSEFKSKGFTVLAVSVDDAGAKEIAQFAKEHGLTYPVVLTGGEDKIPDGYMIFGLPTAYLIDASGIVRRKYYGPKSEQAVAKDIQDILGHAKS